jgi:hypothetical protein
MINGIDILNTSFKILGAIAMGLQPQKEVKKPSEMKDLRLSKRGLQPQKEVKKPCGGCIEKKKKIIKYNNLRKGVK